jgi:hypothetical protein
VVAEVHVKLADGMSDVVPPHRLEHLLVEASAMRISDVVVLLSEVGVADGCHFVGNPW